MMLKKRDRTTAFLLLCAGLLITSALTAVAGDEHQGKEHDRRHGSSATGRSANPLIEEMQVLDGVYREVVSAVSLGDGERVEHALHSMHGTMEKTHEGVRHGGTVKLTKNADKLETFVKMDKEFHGKLEKLAAAAKKNDQQGMLALSKGLLDGCVKCHGMFR
jgi:hypothetical protein